MTLLFSACDIAIKGDEDDEGGYNFLDGLVTPDGCTMMNRCVENMELLKKLINVTLKNKRDAKKNYIIRRCD